MEASVEDDLSTLTASPGVEIQPEAQSSPTVAPASVRQRFARPAISSHLESEPFAAASGVRIVGFTKEGDE